MGYAHSPPPHLRLARPVLQQQIVRGGPLLLGLIQARPGQQHEDHVDCLPCLLRSPVFCKHMRLLHLCCSFRGEWGLERLGDTPRMPSGPGASRIRTTPAPWGSVHCHPVLHMGAAQLKSCLPQSQGSQQNSLRVWMAILDHKALDSEAVKFFWGLRKA